ncbi:MAG: glycosyltransferase family 2 protein, partial [Cyanobacteria bacterium J06631_9]
MADFVEPASTDLDFDDLAFEADFFQGYEGRRLKAAIALSILWLLTAFLHSVTWGHTFVLGVTAIMAIHALR